MKDSKWKLAELVQTRRRALYHEAKSYHQRSEQNRRWLFSGCPWYFPPDSKETVSLQALSSSACYVHYFSGSFMFSFLSPKISLPSSCTEQLFLRTSWWNDSKKSQGHLKAAILCTLRMKYVSFHNTGVLLQVHLQRVVVYPWNALWDCIHSSQSSFISCHSNKVFVSNFF